ncbi:AbrB/MazE/SpoVT family DNA-binding domain-containing protein [Candidatus Woesearchaeota archaeon]|nr:AbrB/MazE/SpoVT family DNA-binding domain-containing protein [Candidatus Woesearchaeota archaeon]
MKCPICNIGVLKKKHIEEVMFGIPLGKFPAELCTQCGESFTDAETTRRIEDVAKKKGIWGLEMKTKITRTGNSLAVRIPKKIADFLNLKEGEEAYIHPEKNRIV